MRASLLAILLLAQVLVVIKADAAAPVAVAQPRAVVQLPAPIEDIVVGGSGQYLIVRLKDRRQLHVIDVVGKKIVKVLPIDDDLIRFAAGATKLVVLHETQGTISRYQLGSWDHELAVSCEAPYNTVIMGCASEGPVYAGVTEYKGINHVQFLDLDTLKERLLPLNNPNRFMQLINVSSDGKCFGSSNGSGSPTGFYLAKLDGATVQVHFELRDTGIIQPGPDGRVIYTGYGMFNSNCQPISSDNNRPVLGLYVPGVTGRYYLMLSNQDMQQQNAPNSSTIATFHVEGHTTPIGSVRGLAIPDLPPGRGSRTGTDSLPLNRRIYYVPNADAVVTIPLSLDRIVIERISMVEELERKNPDYLVAATPHPQDCQRGKELRYQIETLSKHGEPVYELQDAPPGMQVTPDGLLTWTPPLDFEPTYVKCTLTVSDKIGNSLQKRIELQLPPLPKSSTSGR